MDFFKWPFYGSDNQLLNKLPSPPNSCCFWNFLLEVSKSPKQIMMSLILPKNKQNSLSWVCFVSFLEEPGTSKFDFKINQPLAKIFAWGIRRATSFGFSFKVSHYFCRAPLRTPLSIIWKMSSNATVGGAIKEFCGYGATLFKDLELRKCRGN